MTAALHCMKKYLLIVIFGGGLLMFGLAYSKQKNVVESVPTPSVSKPTLVPTNIPVATVTPAPVTQAALTVKLVKARQVEWPLRLSANGSISAWQEAIVGAEASGLRIDEVLVNVGDKVQKGQLLALLQAGSVQAELEQTLAALREAEVIQIEAKANGDRARKLEVGGALTAQQIQQYLTAEQSANARLAGMQAQLKSAQIRLAQTQIIAPDSGTISSRSALLGAVVQPGMELFRLIRRDRLEWRAELPSAELARIRPGMQANVYTPNKTRLKATVRMVAPTVDKQTRNGIVYADLSASGAALPGMYARGDIELGKSKMWVVPQTAVLLRDGFSYVFRVNTDRHVEQIKVTTGQASGEDIAIVAGLDADTPIVLSGVGFLADGDLVRIAP